MIQEINPMTIKEIKVRMQEELQKIGNEFGVDINIGGSTYTSIDFRLKVIVKVRDNGSGKGADQIKYEKYCIGYLLKPEWFGKEFEVFGTKKLKLKIVGWREKARKNPILLEDDKGKRFIASASWVKTFLEKEKN